MLSVGYKTADDFLNDIDGFNYDLDIIVSDL